MRKEKFTTVRLSGELGRRFGKSHRFLVNSPAEAIRALCSQIDGFAAYLADEKNQRYYRVFVANRQIDPEQDLRMQSNSKEIRIAPVIQGAKRGGLFQLILGAALIALAYVPGMQGITFAALGEGVTAAGLSFVMGVGMVLGGVAQMLSPQPKLGSMESVENQPNENFNGPVNTMAANQPVPLAYGRVLVGSATISGGIYTSDLAVQDKSSNSPEKPPKRWQPEPTQNGSPLA